MKSVKSLPASDADISPEERIRQILALSLCVAEVHDADPLTSWPSLDVVESVIVAERALGIPEINDDKLMDCVTIGSLVEIIRAHTPKPVIP